MEIARKIIFYIFFVAYLILCPLIILYSFGYVVYPLKEKLVHTGVIYLSSEPPGAQIFLEKSLFKDITPATLRDLLPGQYAVRLLLRDYRVWNHTVSVEDGKAAVFEKILLIPNNWHTKELTDDSYADLLPLRGTPYFLLSKSDQLKDYYVFDWRKNGLQPLLLPDASWVDLRVSSLVMKEDSPVIVLSGGPLWDRKYLLLQLKSEGADVRDITKLISEKPLQMAWDPSDHDSVFALHEGYVDRLDTLSAALYPKYIEDVRGWGFIRNQIYIIDGTNNVLVASRNKKEFKSVFNNLNLSQFFSQEQDFYEIMPLSNDTIVFLGARGTVIVKHERPLVINQGLAGIEYYPEKERLLVWTKKSIGIIDFLNENEGDLASEEPGQIQWVYEQGRDIRQCFWVYEGSHVIFRDGNKIFLLEPEPQGPAHLDFVTDTKENSSIAYEEAKGVLYYLGEHDGKLKTLDIISGTKFGLVSFIEKEDFSKERKGRDAF